MKNENAIVVKGVRKKFKVYYDKGNMLKERILFWKRNRYEERWVLNGIDFEVKKGEAIALVGHNGCGKSTMLKLLTKIIYPNSGTVETKGRISCLIELGAGFHPDMTGRENIYINASIFGLTKKEIDERIDDIIAFSELEAFMDNPVRTYSSGMYMRLAFAVAINVDADILLIDEILAVGDANFQTKCFNKLREIKASGTTIVLVTHDTGTVERFCERAIWINGGKIEAIGNSRMVVDQYLKYMHEEKVTSLEREAERRTAKQEAESVPEPQQEPQPDVVEQSEETVASVEATEVPEQTSEPEIDYNAIRFGTGTAELTKAVLRDASGKATLLLQSGAPFSIDYSYRVKKKEEELIFGMGIYTLEGVFVYGTNTMLAGVRVNAQESGKLTFVCSNLPLLSGRYILQVAICDINNTPVDFHREYCRFDVVSSSRDAGILTLDNEWLVE